MKNSIKTFICILFLLNSTNVFSQKHTLETETDFMNCFYKSLPDNGTAFKIILQKAEQKLIEKKFLKDGTGESYTELYKNLENIVDEELQNLGVLTYMAAIQEQMNTLENQKCMENVFESPKYIDSKLFKFIELTQSLDSHNGDTSEMIHQILTILAPKDFEHEYYKMTTFTMIETINYVDLDGAVSGLPEEVEETFTTEELESALKIEINSEEQLLVNKEKSTLKELQKKVKNYLLKNTSESVIVFNADRMVAYKVFIDVQNEIIAAFDAVRDQSAKEKFNLPFDEVTQKQQKEIKKKYPLKIKSTLTNE